MKGEQHLGHSDRPMLDLHDYPPTRSIGSIDLRDTHLIVAWDFGDIYSFHYAWFRENCAYSKCRKSFTLEHRIDPLDSPFEIKPADCGLTRERALLFTWPDGHESEFSAAWIRIHASENERNLRPTFVEDTGWEFSPDVELPETSNADWMENEICN